MFYLTKISFELIGVGIVREKSFYYSILGLILSLLENEKFIKDKVLKISYKLLTDNILEVKIVFFGEDTFKSFVNEVLSKVGNYYDLNGIPVKLRNLNFDFFHLNIEKIKRALEDNKLYRKVRLDFLSPTVVRRWRKEILLPLSEVYLINILNKVLQTKYLSDYLGELIEGMNNKDFKKWLKFNVLPQRFNIRTVILTLKSWQMVGIRGYVFYWIYNIDNEWLIYLKMLKLQSILSPYIWLGSFVKLGLGDVSMNLTLN